jgi:hypothetical protein
VTDTRDHETPDHGLDATDHDTDPPADRGLQAAAGVLLLLPIVALMWVSSYARPEPRVAGFPFFIWYQFLWVFLCSACTYGAYRLNLKARPHRVMTHQTNGPAARASGPSGQTSPGMGSTRHDTDPDAAAGR